MELHFQQPLRLTAWHAQHPLLVAAITGSFHSLLWGTDNAGQFPSEDLLSRMCLLDVNTSEDKPSTSFQLQLDTLPANKCFTGSAMLTASCKVLAQ